jgi:hypothetical protein
MVASTKRYNFDLPYIDDPNGWRGRLPQGLPRGSGSASPKRQRSCQATEVLSIRAKYSGYYSGAVTDDNGTVTGDRDAVGPWKTLRNV